MESCFDGTPMQKQGWKTWLRFAFPDHIKFKESLVTQIQCCNVWDIVISSWRKLVFVFFSLKGFPKIQCSDVWDIVIAKVAFVCFLVFPRKRSSTLIYLDQPCKTLEATKPPTRLEQLLFDPTVLLRSRLLYLPDLVSSLASPARLAFGGIWRIFLRSIWSFRWDTNHRKINVAVVKREIWLQKSIERETSWSLWVKLEERWNTVVPKSRKSNGPLRQRWLRNMHI